MLSWPLALAAPWVQGDGELYVRTAIASEQVESLEGYRADIYAEYGLSERWTLSLKSEAVAYPDAQDFNVQGWRATARRQMFASGGFRASLEGGLLQGAAIGGRNGCETLGAEVRGGVAWSGTWRKTETFTHLEFASRLHDGCRRDRFEFGLGQKLIGPIWSVSQLWYEDGTVNARSQKNQTELLWKAEAFEASVGYRKENGGFFDEEGIFIALAGRF